MGGAKESTVDLAEAPGEPGPEATSSWLRTTAAVVGLVLVALLLAAHFLRRGQLGGAITIALAPSALLLGRPWVGRLLTFGLLAGALVWLQTTILFVRIRLSIGLPYGRLLLILGTVTLLTALSPRLLRVGALARRWHERAGEPLWAPTFAALLTAVLLAVVQLKVPRPMLLAERFAPGFGWLQIAGAALYAGLAAEKLLSARAAIWRRRLWTLFSLVFFAQLALGLTLDARFLMRPDALHLPIPALILGGPLYRGEHFFMLILFLSTLVLVGPAWCSHICYLGAWDNLAAQAGPKRPRALPTWSLALRLALLSMLVLAAFGLGRLGASPFLAGAIALAFGLGGVALMLLYSRRRGTMVHCALYCPIGLVANVLGKISPFRLRIGAGCTACGRCTVACRYDALGPERLAAKRVGLNCTLCGDCLPTCRSGDIRMWLPGAGPTVARGVFVCLVVALHAASLCLARV